MVTSADLLQVLGVDLRRFLYDNQFDADSLDEAIVSTGAVTRNLTELKVETGALSGSSARVNYNFPCFNPWYSTLMFKAQFSSINNIFAFIGLKATATTPTSTMDESHCGFMIETVNNVPSLFVTSGRIYNSVYYQQKIKVTGWDPTKYLIYRIVKDKFASRPLPVITPYFDGIAVVDTTRQWSADIQTGNNPANDQDHYFVAYIRNTINTNRTLRINHVLYGESYAD